MLCNVTTRPCDVLTKKHKHEREKEGERAETPSTVKQSPAGGEKMKQRNNACRDGPPPFSQLSASSCCIPRVPTDLLTFRLPPATLALSMPTLLSATAAAAALASFLAFSASSFLARSSLSALSFSTFRCARYIWCAFFSSSEHPLILPVSSKVSL